jgi:protein-tyrosine phosphatase
VAEGVFLHLARAKGLAARFEVDSAGTGGWHSGERPDPRSLALAERKGIHLPSRARQVTTTDLSRYDWLLAMDRQNRGDLLALGAAESRTRLLLSFDPAASTLEVPDPYYGGPDGFERMYDLILPACQGLLDHLTDSGDDR